MIFVYKVEIDVDIKSWLKCPQGATLQFLSNGLRKQNGYWWHKPELVSYKVKVYWNAVRSLFLPVWGKVCIFSRMLIFLHGEGKAKQERHTHQSTTVLMTASSMWVSGAKWYLNQKCAEAVLWVSTGSAQQHYCIMQNVCHMQNALVGHHRPLFQEIKKFLGDKAFKIIICTSSHEFLLCLKNSYSCFRSPLGG